MFSSVYHKSIFIEFVGLVMLLQAHLHTLILSVMFASFNGCLLAWWWKLIRTAWSLWFPN